MSDIIIKSVPQEEQDKAEQNGLVLVDKANTAVILTGGQYKEVNEIRKMAKDFQAAVKAVWDPVCENANKAHKTATAARKDQMAPFVEAETICKKKLNEYDMEQERIAREEADRLRKIREKDEREKREEQDRKLAEAAALEKAGKSEEATALLDDAVDIQEELETMPEIVVQKDVPTGVTYIDNWKAEVIHAHLVPREYCVPDEKMLNATAKATKGSAVIAGVRFYNNRTVR